jgi:phosphoadenosine phosphosulfate reductase
VRGVRLRASEAAALNERLERRSAEERLAFAVETFGARLLFTSSFGAGSGVLLHLWSRIARHLPVVFLDTGFLFPETLEYKDALASFLGLSVKTVHPSVSKDDFTKANGADAYRTDPDRCCETNKIAPLRPLLAEADGWVSGLRRAQGPSRAETPILLVGQDGLTKVHPLATMTAQEAARYMERHRIPEHPVRAQGFASIGCAPCTRAILPGEDERAGRWAWTGKTECGLHTRLVRRDETPASSPQPGPQKRAS